MKNARTKLLFMVCIVVLCFSFTGCGSGKGKKNDTAGTYTAQTTEDEAYNPNLSLFEDNTYQFNLSVGSYFKGTYVEKNDQLVLTLTDNASKVADNEITSLTLDYDKENSQFTLTQEIPGFVKPNTIFKR